MPTLTFRSRVDTWLLIVLLIPPAVVIATVLKGVPRHPVELAIAVAIGIGLPAWLLTTTRYRLSSDTLLIVSGPFRWKIPIDEIKGVEPTRSLWSSPALSLRRLVIRYGVHRSIMISPADEEGFLRALEERRRAAG